MIQETTQATWSQNVLEASKEKPVLVDFHAQWCMPCKMMAPVLEQLSEEMADSAVIAKIDVDQERQLAMEFQIMSIPTLGVFRNGALAEKTVGMQSADQLKALIERHK